MDPQHDDIVEVRDLYSRYALSWDENHPDDLAECFTRDAIFESQRGRFEGRDAILENMANVNKALGEARQRHVTTNVNIKLEGERGAATAYFIYCVGRAGKLEVTAFGKYEDELRKENGRWFFSSRKGIVEGQATH
jgi:3-phenylpropionate/cinnamic acid dioxygenase small subunit